MGTEPISELGKMHRYRDADSSEKASSKEIRDSSATDHLYVASAIRMKADPETTRFMAFMSLIVAMLEEKEND